MDNMATGGQDDTSEIDASVISGSEAVYDHVCQPCSDDEKTKEAVGFCVDCAEWLCDDCFRIHTRPKPWRHHVLRNLKEMKNSTSPPKLADKCTEKCKQHTGKKLKYYCPVHDLLGCSLCVIQGHGTCKVDHIPDVSESSDIKGQFRKVTAKLEVIARESNDTVSKVNKNEQLIENSKTEAVTACRRYIHKLKESLDETGSALEETCVKQAEEETKKMRHVSKKCEAVEKESLGIKAHLEDLESSGQLCNTFIALKQSEGNLKLLANKLEDAKSSSSASTYTFKPNLAIEKTVVGLEGIGSLVEHHSRIDRDRDYSIVQARHVVDISVKGSGSKTCGITGSTFLSPHKLVVCDYDNKQVKLIDTRTNKIISEYEVDGTPWDVCKEGDNSVVVTVWDKSKLIYLSVCPMGTFTMTKSILVNGKCKGIDVCGDKMAVAFVSNPHKLEIMDTSGIVLQTFDDPQIVDYPQYVVASPDKNSVYVSGYSNSTLICVNIDGTLTATYKDSKLRGVEKATIDSNGMLYVGGCLSKNVLLLTPDCKEVKVLLDESDGLENVYAVSYCQQTDRLYIGMDQCDVIKVFQLS